MLTHLRRMTPPLVLRPDQQGAWDVGLGSQTGLLVAALLDGRLRLVAAFLAQEAEEDGDLDSEEEALLLLVSPGPLTVAAAGAVIRQLKQSASLDLGGQPRITSSHVFDDAACRHRFRFTALKLEELHFRLFGEQRVVVVGHEAFNTMEALLVTLQKLAFPTRLRTLSDDYGRHVSTLSRMFNWVVLEYMADHHARLFGNPARFRPFVRDWIHAARDKGVPFDGIGAIDGTRMGIARPGRYQELCYNGYFGGHCLNYLLLVGANGLVLTMYGPVEGTRHDAHLFRVGAFHERLEQLLGGHRAAYPLVGVGADSAFPQTEYVYPIIKSTKANPVLPGSPERAYNTSNSRLLRIISEWGVKQTKLHWKALGLTAEMPLWRPGCGVGNLFCFATFLSNAMSCSRGGNQISSYYGLAAPSLEIYMA